MAGLPQGGAGPLPGRKLLKLLPLNVNQVPWHPDLHAQEATHRPPALAGFVKQCLNEASEDGLATFQKMGEAKETYEVGGKKRVVVVEKLKKRDDVEGTWFARRSVHEDVSYEELDGVLRKQHERNEMEYTPAIYDVNTVLEWKVEEEIEGVRDVELRGESGVIGIDSMRDADWWLQLHKCTIACPRRRCLTIASSLSCLFPLFPPLRRLERSLSRLTSSFRSIFPRSQQLSGNAAVQCRRLGSLSTRLRPPRRHFSRSKTEESSWKDVMSVLRRSARLRRMAKWSVDGR